MTSTIESFDLLKDGLIPNLKLISKEIEEEIKDIEHTIQRIKDKMKYINEIIICESFI